MPCSGWLFCGCFIPPRSHLLAYKAQDERHCHSLGDQVTEYGEEQQESEKLTDQGKQSIHFKSRQKKRAAANSQKITCLERRTNDALSQNQTDQPRTRRTFPGSIRPHRSPYC